MAETKLHPLLVENALMGLSNLWVKLPRCNRTTHLFGSSYEPHCERIHHVLIRGQHRRIWSFKAW